MKETIKKGVIFGLTSALTMILIGLTYAAITHVSSGETLTASKFNELIDATVPSGTISAFYLSSCPTGWIVANGTNSTPDLRGTFIRGDLGEENSRDVVRNIGDYQDDAFESHKHPLKTNNGEQHDYIGGSTADYGLDTQGNGGDLGGAIGLTGDSETRPKNVALLYCMKQ